MAAGKIIKHINARKKSSSLKCTSCGWKGRIAKACYTNMLKKSGAIKTNTVQASPIPGQLAIKQEATSLSTRMIRATILANTTSSTEHNLPMVQTAGQVEVDGRIVDLDAPLNPIPNLWLWLRGLYGREEFRSRQSRTQEQWCRWYLSRFWNGTKFPLISVG